MVQCGAESWQTSGLCGHHVLQQHTWNMLFSKGLLRVVPRLRPVQRGLLYKLVANLLASGPHYMHAHHQKASGGKCPPALHQWVGLPVQQGLCPQAPSSHHMHEHLKKQILASANLPFTSGSFGMVPKSRPARRVLPPGSKLPLLAPGPSRLRLLRDPAAPRGASRAAALWRCLVAAVPMRSGSPSPDSALWPAARSLLSCSCRGTGQG